MPIAQSKRKLIAATALFIAVGALTGAIATGGAATISFAQTQEDGGAATGQQGGQERIVRQGTVTSGPEPTPGHEGHQFASILPLREDGSIYSGVLTYTASVPVEVVVLNVQTLNETERSIVNATDEEDGFGTILTTPLDNETSIAIHVITPPYGDTPVPSTSIPFAGNAVWLHTLDGTPFVANYAVSAQTVPAETQNAISNVTLATAAEAEEDADAEDADAEDADAAEDGADAEDADAAEDGADDGADAEEDADTTPTTPTPAA